MSAHTEAAENLKRLADLSEQKAETARKLASAFLIQSIWPEAFDGDQKCALRFNTRKNGFNRTMVTRRYLRRSDGVEFEITRAQHKLIMGDRYVEPS